MKHLPSVYLSGPISGLTYQQATGWRHLAKEYLGSNFRIMSPLRAKIYLMDIGVLYADNSTVYGSISPLSTQRGVMTRDHMDTTKADVILAYLLDSPSPSIGTAMEIAWAWDHRIPIVAVLPDDEHLGAYNHPMLLEAIDFRTTSLDEACTLIKAIILP